MILLLFIKLLSFVSYKPVNSWWYISKFFCYALLGFIFIKLPIVQPLVESFCEMLANATYYVTYLFDNSVKIQKTVIFRKSAYAVDVSKACSALGYVVILFSAILAYPTKLRKKVRLLLEAFLFIQVLNVIRITSLLYARSLLDMQQFNFIHEQLWIYIFLLAVCSFFIFKVCQFKARRLININFL